MRYEIDENNAVRVYEDGDDVPFLFQPDYPNLDPFDSKEEAENWAKLVIAAFDPDQPYAPAGKGLPGEPKQTAEQIAEAQKRLRM